MELWFLRSVWSKIINCGLWVLVVMNIQPSQGLSNSPEFPACFVFGDSLLDVGNNNRIPSLARADFPPHGIDYPRGTTGRFSNGQTLIDPIFDLIGLPPSPAFLDPSTNGNNTLQGINYASGGAGILDETGIVFMARISMFQQINYFRITKQKLFGMLGETATSDLLAESLFIIGIGSNDYLNNYLLSASPIGLQYNPKEFQDLLLTTYSSQLRELYRMGARKLMVLSLGPLGCVPSYIVRRSLSESCVAETNTMASNFNNGLQKMLTLLNIELSNAQYIYIDAYNPVMRIVNNPLSHGFLATTAACCGLGRLNGLWPCLPSPMSDMCTNRDAYIFWDFFHTTHALNVILGGQFYDQLKKNMFG